MKPALVYPIAVGVLTGLSLTLLDAFHVGEHSAWRAALVGGLCGGLVYWIGPKLAGKSIKRTGSL
ncbi:hypothetical protein [Sphingomonas abietis]|uniref:Uncharacterized protein n=1 Tax=Sphingomonas abietis TaxID=3012344 RepID=A0ABY7NMG6_9SPHN|nr:hypothetical protein [Sphingomonas abietis]WBO22704.1 hypothetical protein PBT88_00680 [Sphingomonas abietis]